MPKKIVYECDSRISDDCQVSIEIPANDPLDADYIATEEYDWKPIGNEWFCPECVKKSKGGWREAIGCASGICGGQKPEEAIRNIRG